jgi:hypothetical protein
MQQIRMGFCGATAPVAEPPSTSQDPPAGVVVKLAPCTEPLWLEQLEGSGLISASM